MLKVPLLRYKAVHISLRLSSTYSSTFKYEDLEVIKTKNPQPKPDNKNLVFGNHFSDHMLTVDWSAKDGWTRPLIHPLEELRIHPAAKVLHYAQELFEGVKAYRCVDGKIRMFQPMENMKRMLIAAQRASLPAFDGAELSKCIKRLVSIDSDWVPDAENCSLYIRPAFIGTEPTLGFMTTNAAKLFVVACPVGLYFPKGFRSITLLADPQYVRAWPGGCGAYKMGSNYATSIHVQDIAEREHGCQQVLWLYGEDHMMTEMGTMNLFVYWINENGEEELATPALNGLILAGVTRKSLLNLARDWNEFKVNERDISMKQFTKALAENRVMEMFGSGTACTLCPVGWIKYLGQTLEIPTMKEAKLTKKFSQHLSDIQYGRIPHPWMEAVDEEADHAKKNSHV